MFNAFRDVLVSTLRFTKTFTSQACSNPRCQPQLTRNFMLKHATKTTKKKLLKHNVVQDEAREQKLMGQVHKTGLSGFATRLPLNELENTFFRQLLRPKNFSRVAEILQQVKSLAAWSNARITNVSISLHSQKHFQRTICRFEKIRTASNVFFRLFCSVSVKANF